MSSMIPGIIMENSSTLNKKFFPINFILAKEYAAILEENMPTIVTGTAIFSVLIKPERTMLSPVAKIVYVVKTLPYERTES